MSENKYIPCNRCKNFAYCLETGDWKFNLPECPCEAAERVDEED